MSDTEPPPISEPTRPAAAQAHGRKARTPAQLAVFERMQAAIKEKRARLAQDRVVVVAPPPDAPPKAPPAPPRSTKPPRAHRVKKPVEQIVKEVIEAPSSDDSSDSSDGDDGERVVRPLREIYKDKYKAKYSQKYQARTTQQLTKGVAHTALRSRVDDEMHRLARVAIFGS